MDEKTLLYLKYKNKRKLAMFRDLRVTSVALLLLVASLASVGGVSAAISTKPAVSNFVVAPVTLNYPGGRIRLSAEVKNATKCIFRVSPAVAGIDKNMACTNGVVIYTPSLPKNISSSNIVYTFKLIVAGRKGKGVAVAPLKRVTVVAAPRPVIKSFTASVSGLPNAGGNVTLTGQVANEIGCSITASPAIQGTSSNIVPCGSGSISVPVVMPANSSSSQINYVFTLTVNGDVSATTKVLTVIVYPTSTVPTTTTTTPPPTTTTPPPVSTGNTISVPAGPDAFVQAGSDIWVASCQGNAVTEINKNTKQIIMTLTNTSNPDYHYGFSCPDALAYDGSHIWVANESGNSLTQFDESTGAWIRTVTASDIAAPIALAFDGTHIWVGNANNTINGPALSLVAFDSSSGNIFNATKNTMLQYPSTPTCIAFTGTDLWVSDSGGQTAFEYSLTGRYLRSTSLSGGGGVSGVDCVSYHGGYIWISSTNTTKVFEYNASNGAYIKEINEPESPTKLIFTGSYLFVVNASNVEDLVLEYQNGVLKKTVAKFSASKGVEGVTMLYDGANLWVADSVGNRVILYNT